MAEIWGIAAAVIGAGGAIYSANKNASTAAKATAAAKGGALQPWTSAGPGGTSTNMTGGAGSNPFANSSGWTNYGSLAGVGNSAGAGSSPPSAGGATGYGGLSTNSASGPGATIPGGSTAGGGTNMTPVAGAGSTGNTALGRLSSNTGRGEALLSGGGSLLASAFGMGGDSWSANSHNAQQRDRAVAAQQSAMADASSGKPQQSYADYLKSSGLPDNSYTQQAYSTYQQAYASPQAAQAQATQQQNIANGGGTQTNSAGINLGNQNNAIYGGNQTVMGQSTGIAGNLLNGLPQDIMNQYGQTQALTNQDVSGLGTQNGLQQQAGLQSLGQGMAFGQAAAGANQLNSPLIQQSQQAAGNLIGTAGQSYTDTYNNSLQNLLQQLQQPQQQTMNANQNKQFQMGMLGTTGGALQTQAMAQGFGQADLQAQQTAYSQALAAQNASVSNAGALSNIGINQQNSGSSLMNSGLANAGNLGNNASNNYNSQYNQNLGLNQTQLANSQTGLNNSIQYAGLPSNLANQYLGTANNAQNNMTGLFNQGNALYNDSLNSAIAQSNSANKVATNTIAAGGLNSGGTVGNVLGIGAGLLANPDVQSSLNNMFSNAAAPATTNPGNVGVDTSQFYTPSTDLSGISTSNVNLGWGG